MRNTGFTVYTTHLNNAVYNTYMHAIENHPSSTVGPTVGHLINIHKLVDKISNLNIITGCPHIKLCMGKYKSF